MKYPCDLIRDLLPLYLDGVCSAESKKAVESHLEVCPACRAYYQTMHEAEKMEMEPQAAGQELRKAASFQKVKKRLLRKQLLAAAAAVIVLTLIAAAAVGILKQTVDVVEYQENLSVSIEDGDLVGRLQGSGYAQVKIKNITASVQGQERNYLFFYVTATKWDELTTGAEVFSEFTLSYGDKGADQVDAVYYYTGEYADMEAMSSGELQNVIEDSVCLWEK
jgi:hypothetical protein